MGFAIERGNGLMSFSKEQQKQGIGVARNIADWLCNCQHQYKDADAESGRILALVNPETGELVGGCQWTIAFSVMGLLSASKAFNSQRYYDAAMHAARYLKSLQVFNPFMERHYGAIRETAPQTPWCYPRDSISAGWAFIELYRETGDGEWLERAVLFAKWFIKEAMDEEGWPYWGVQLEPFFDPENPPQICNDIQGSFHGGSLNFLYQLARETGDNQWTGDLFVNMADHFVDHLQQPDGFFRSIERGTHRPPPDDPQKGLHRANDDLGTLGLLGAYKVTGDKKYLEAIERFIAGVFTHQQPDGMFEESVACIPIVLNILHETDGLIDRSPATSGAVSLSLQALYNSMSTTAASPGVYGALIEKEPGRLPSAVGRSNNYALIVLLKLFKGIGPYFTA